MPWTRAMDRPPPHPSDTGVSSRAMCVQKRHMACREETGENGIVPSGQGYMARARQPSGLPRRRPGRGRAPVTGQWEGASGRGLEARSLPMLGRIRGDGNGRRALCLTRGPPPPPPPDDRTRRGGGCACLRLQKRGGGISDRAMLVLGLIAKRKKKRKSKSESRSAMACSRVETRRSGHPPPKPRLQGDASPRGVGGGTV